MTRFKTFGFVFHWLNTNDLFEYIWTWPMIFDFIFVIFEWSLNIVQQKEIIQKQKLLKNFGVSLNKNFILKIFCNIVLIRVSFRKKITAPFYFCSILIFVQGRKIINLNITTIISYFCLLLELVFNELPISNSNVFLNISRRLMQNGGISNPMNWSGEQL